MSLARHVERCIANQEIHRALNAVVRRAQPVLSEPNAGVSTAVSSEKGIRGRLISIKDNICSWETTCGSKMLVGHISPYQATVAKKLEEAGAVPVSVAGKTNLDEFGMGSHSTTSVFGPVRNHISSETGVLSAGGSSGGSAVAVATGQCWAALGTDTGGSVRLPAAYTGIVGFKPSYGRLSRHGVITYANSLDTVGILAPNVSIAREVFEVSDGPDPLDPTSLSHKARQRLRSKMSERIANADPSAKLRIGVPEEYNIAELDSDVRDAWAKVLGYLAQQGHTVHVVSMAATKLALSAYYILAPAEASSNLAKYDGVRFGNNETYLSETDKREVLFSDVRGRNLGEEVKRRILLGSYSLSASAIDNYFLKAQRVRRLVQRDFENALARSGDSGAGVDVLISPTAPSLPPTLESVAGRTPVESYRDDVLTVPASLAGVPAISVPVAAQKGIGMQITAQYGYDETALYAAEVLEQMGSRS